MTDEAIKEKLRKVLQLARKGVGGEQANAQEVFQSLCAKHGIELADLEDVKKWHKFHYLNRTEYDLLIQLYAVVTDTAEGITTRKPRRLTVYFELSEADRFQMEFLYSMYRRQLRKEQKRLYSAFLHKHRLFPKTGGVREIASAEEINELRRIQRMAGGMDEVHRHKPLEN